MQLQTNAEALSTPKRRRTRKRHWRERWLVLSDGAKLEAREIRRGGPKPPSSQLGYLKRMAEEVLLTKPQRFEINAPRPPRMKRGRSVLGQVNPLMHTQLEDIGAIMVREFDADERRSAFGNRRSEYIPRGVPCGIQFRLGDESNIVELGTIRWGSKDDRRKQDRRNKT
jgi:hypothetical protein